MFFKEGRFVFRFRTAVVLVLVLVVVVHLNFQEPLELRRFQWCNIEDHLHTHLVHKDVGFPKSRGASLGVLIVRVRIYRPPYETTIKPISHNFNCIYIHSSFHVIFRLVPH